MSIEPRIERFLQRTPGITFCADCLTEAARLPAHGVTGRLQALMHRARVAALIATTFRHFSDRVVTEGACGQCGTRKLVVRKLLAEDVDPLPLPRSMASRSLV